MNKAEVRDFKDILRCVKCGKGLCYYLPEVGAFGVEGLCLEHKEEKERITRSEG